jgi:hypothetical protein
MVREIAIRGRDSIATGHAVRNRGIPHFLPCAR